MERAHRDKRNPASIRWEKRSSTPKFPDPYTGNAFIKTQQRNKYDHLILLTLIHVWRFESEI